MLVKIQPEQVSSLWDVIKYTALTANNVLDKDVPRFCEYVLTNILAGKIQVWASFVREENVLDVQALLLTCIVTDTITGKKHLSVHSAFGFKPLSAEIVNETLHVFEKFAKDSECNKIVVSTTNEKLVKLWEFLGLSREMFVYSKML